MGFAAGFQVGASAVERGLKMREEDKMKRELAQAYAKPEEFVDYTPDQLKQIQGLQAAGGYDVQAVPGAEGQAPTLRYTAKPQSMYYDDMGQPEAPIEIAPQRVQRYGGQTVAGQFDPMQLQGLQMREAARIVGASGDPVRAAQMMAEATRMEREAVEAPLRLEALRNQVTAGKLGLTKTQQDIESGSLTLEQQKRLAVEQQNATNFSNFAAENPNATVAELKEAAFKQFKFTPKQWQETVATRLQIETGEMDSFKNGIKKKLQGKNLQQLGSLYNTDPDFDDKTDLAIVPGKGGAVTLNFIDKASGRVTSTQSFKSEALATEYLNKQATEPENIGSWMLALQKTQSGIAAQEAQIRASDATVGLRNQQMQMLRTQAAGNAEAQAIRADYEALTPEEQVGPKGQGLIRQFNMANTKAGTPIPLGTAPRAATGPAREMSDLDKENLREYRAWVKDPRNAKLPQGQKDAYAAQLGVTEFINRAAAGPTTGVGSNPYATPQPGAAPAPAPAAAPAAAPAPTAAPAPVALSTENTKLLGRAGNTGYNVQLPDGTTQVMSISQLNKLGYQFPSGTGLQRAWYEDLLPRR